MALKKQPDLPFNNVCPDFIALDPPTETTSVHGERSRRAKEVGNQLVARSLWKEWIDRFDGIIDHKMPKDVKKMSTCERQIKKK
jgi:hypothetical protein